MLLSSLCAPGCTEGPQERRSAGSPCETSDQCESNLCYESLCVAGPRAEEAPDVAEPMDISPVEAVEGPEPLSCSEVCQELALCELYEGGTEEECVTWCEENPTLLSPLFRACIPEHLSGGQCDEEGFSECADGPVLDFFERVAEVVCGRVKDCCPLESSPLGSVEDCQGLIVGFAGGIINATELMGYLTFHAPVAESCATKIEETLPGTECAEVPVDMGPYLGQLASCQGLWTALQAEGEPCGITTGETFEALGEGCIEGLICEAEGDAMPTCRPGLGVGDECSAEGDECSGETHCFEGLCAAQRGLGEPCLSDAQCQSDNCEEEACGGPSTLECL